MRITNKFLLKARDIDTRVTGRTTGHPVRTLRNPMTKEYLEKEAAGASFEELEMLTLGGLRKAVVDGDVKTGSVMSGQIAGMVKDVPTCKELMDKTDQRDKRDCKEKQFSCGGIINGKNSIHLSGPGCTEGRNGKRFL